jgi:outer membrane protein assembly complex protein YaeT
VKLFLRRLFRWKNLLILLICFVLLLVLILAGLQTPWVRGLVLRKAAAYVEQRYGIYLSAQSLAYNPLTLSFSLRNFSLTTASPKVSVRLQADDVAVQIPLSLVLGKQLRIKDLTIIRPRVQIVASAPGPPHLVPAGPAPAPSPPMTRLPAFIVDRAQLREGVFVFSDASRHIDVEMDGIEVDIRHRRGALHSIRLDSRDPSFAEVRQIHVPVEELSLTADFDRDRAHVENLSLEIGPNRVRLAGDVEDFFAPRIRADLQAVLEGVTLRDSLNLKEKVEGRLNLRAALSGSIEALAAEGSFAARGVGLGPWRNVDLEGTFGWRPDSFRIPSFRFSSPDGKLSGRMQFLKINGEADNSVEVSWSLLNLALISEVARLPFRVASRASGSARASWGRPFLGSLRGKAETELAPHPVGGTDHGAVVLSGSLTAEVRPAAVPDNASELNLSGRLADSAGREIEIDARSILDAQYLNLTALQLTFSGGVVSASGRWPLRAAAVPFALTAKAENIDLEGTARFLALSFPVRGVLAVEAAASGTLRRPEINLRISGENLAYGKIELGRADLQGKTTGATLRFHFSLPSYSVSAEGDLGMRSPYDLDGKITISRLTAESLAEFLFPEIRPKLVASLAGSINIRAALARPAQTFRMDAEFEDIRFGLPGHVLASQGIIRLAFDGNSLVVDNLTLVGQGSDIKIHGSVPVRSTASTHLNIEAGIDLALLDLVQQAVKIQGRLTLSGTVTGVLSSPEINLTAEVNSDRVDWGQWELPLTDLEISLGIKDNQVRLEKTFFRWGRARAAVSGRFPLDLLLPIFKGGAGGVAFRGEVGDLDPAELGLALSVPALQKTDGSISLTFSAQGEAFDWRKLTGDIEIGSLRLTEGRLSLALSESARIHLKKGQAEIRGLELSGADTKLRINGAIDLAQKSIPGLVLSGGVQLGILRPFLPEGQISGSADLEIRVSGDLAEPRVEGSLRIRNGQVSWPSLDLSLSGVSGRAALDKSRILIQDVRGSLNHGSLEVQGEIGWTGLKVGRADIQIKGSNILTNYPQGFMVEWNLSLAFTSEGGRQRLGGKVAMIQGEYTQDFNFRSGLLRLLKGGSPSFYAQRNPFLKNLSFTVDIVTTDPFVVRNNMVNAEIRAALRLGGTPYNPGLGGGILVLEGGQIVFGGNTYQIEQGRVDFVNPNRIEPDLNLKALTRVSGYSIQLSVSGTPARLSASLTSDPPLPEADIISLLTSGSVSQNASSSISSALGNRAMVYLEQVVTGQIGKTIASGLGLETLHIDTSLVAPQESPEARITVGKHLTPKLELILSQDMRNANVRTIILNHRTLRDLNFQVLSQDNNEFRLSSQGELRFGPSTPATGALNPLGEKKRLQLGRIALSGELGFPEKEIRKHLRLKEGKEFDFINYTKALQKLEDFYAGAGYLDVSVEPKREIQEGRVSISIQVQAGRRIEFETDGMKLPGSLRQEIRRAWMDETFEATKPDDVARRIRSYLCSKRYYLASVRTTIEDRDAAGRQLSIAVAKGPRFNRPSLVFSGNRGLTDSQLRRAVDPESFCREAISDRDLSVQNIRDLYRENGYLEARAEGPDIEYSKDGRTVRASFKIEEGPLFVIRGIEFEGNLFFDSARLLKTSGLREGEVFRPERFDWSKLNLQAAYEAEGFIDVAVDAGVALHPEGAGVDIKYVIRESFQAVIEDIRLSGTRLTRPSFVRNILSFRRGDLVDYRKINESRRNLYDLGVFSTLSINLAAMDKEQGQFRPVPGNRNPRQPYAAEIEVAEAKPFTVIGGLQYDTETSFGGNATLADSNLLGRAIALGGSTILDNREQTGRVFVRGQYFLGKKIDSILSVFYDHRNEPSFSLRRRGVTLQQQLKFRERYVLSYDYTFERDSSVSADTALNQINNIGRVSLSLAHDSRDSFFNPTKGTFNSGTLEYGARALGSDVSYVRFLGQTFHYLRLTPRLLFASAVRLGLEKGFGQAVPIELRFFTGGGNTVRGYSYHEIGARDPATGTFVGGEALLVLNEELRFPIYKLIGGVVFLDLGNVYPTVSDFAPLRLRSAAGFGLRLNAGVLVGRFDVGFKLNRQPGESASRVYFSIGQVF